MLSLGTKADMNKSRERKDRTLGSSRAFIRGSIKKAGSPS